MISRRRPAGDWFYDNVRIQAKRADLERYSEKYSAAHPMYPIINVPERLPQFFTLLRESFGNKCVFCEARLDALPDTAFTQYLFRPARFAAQSKQERSSYPDHYFWLQLEWSNIYLFCGECAASKGFQFPVARERVLVKGAGLALRTEDPLLLDPCDHLENPLALLEFSEDGTVSAKPGARREAAAETIQVFSLNRDTLVKARAAEAVRLRQLLPLALDELAILDDPSAQIARLQAECDDLAQFAGMKRQLLFRWLDPGLRRRRLWKSFYEQLVHWNSTSSTESPQQPMVRKEFANGYASLIGVGLYRDSGLPDIPSSPNDARGLYRVLSDPKQCGYPPQNIRLATNAEATRAFILGELQRLAEASRRNPNMTALFFFSGHGALIHDQFYLLPSGTSLDDPERTAISGAELFAAIHAIASERRLILLDCCHAGAIAAAAVGKGAPAAPHSYDSLQQHQLLQELDRGQGTAIISSSTVRQESYAIKNVRYSLFTGALIEALLGQGTPDQAEVISVFHVFNYVQNAVRQRASELRVLQEPHIHFNGVGFDVALRPRKR